MFANFARHIDKHGECKFILVSESGKFNWKRMSGHPLTSYPFRNGRGTAAYFIPEVFQNLLTKIGSVPRFLHIDNTAALASAARLILQSHDLQSDKNTGRHGDAAAYGMHETISY